MNSLQLWGGVECTHNRVGDRYFSQLEWNGHTRRTDDLERFATLGFSALRTPILWETHGPNGENEAEIDWKFADRTLETLNSLGIAPIVGLVHHGSGPRHASIETPDFASGVAQFAGQVARRFPHVAAYTPINEPLTTARFCGLYGHWFPHGNSDAVFVRVLLNECRAIVLAMREIRRVNSAAQLIQTEDLGRIFSTPALCEQAQFESERRWLAFDLVSGRVGREHALWSYLLWAGASERELDWFGENPCPPNIIGANYYPTSDRFLDDDLSHYPAHWHGGNGRQRYADIEAVRVLDAGELGFAPRLREAWARFQTPLAVTEAHLGCSREEQLRWLHGAWNDAKQLRDEGADVRAVTAWSLLGSFNWNSLVTRDENSYESGIFDVRGPQIRPTALAKLCRELAQNGAPSHPVLAQSGWWNRPHRLIYPFCFSSDERRQRSEKSHSWRQNWSDWEPKNAPRGEKPIVILGASGTLGNAFARACEARGLPYFLLARHELDVRNAAQIAEVLGEIQPFLVVNATGFVRVDEAESEAGRALCFEVNTAGAIALARVCAAQKIGLICFSSDLVFDGKNREKPYLESDETAPLNAYGASKAAMEQGVFGEFPGALIVRTSAFWSPHDEWNFVTQSLDALARGETVCCADDVHITPTYVPELTKNCLDLALDGESGMWHLACRGAVSWHEFARESAQFLGVSTERLNAVSHRELGWLAPRPIFCALGSEQGMLLPHWHDCLEDYRSKIGG